MAILDSGADATSYPNHVVERLDHLSSNPRQVETEIQLVYGNGESVTIDRMVDHGIYEILITPDHCGECLISGDQINSTGHIVILTNTETIITDIMHRYTLRYPRDPGAKDYPVPLDMLHTLSELRKQHPLTEQAQLKMQKPYQLPHNDRPRRFKDSKYLRARKDIPQISHVRSGRLREIPRSTLGRVLRLHKRMGHAPEDIMCMAVEPKEGKPLWRNTKVTAKEIRRVFQWEPCLICCLLYTSALPTNREV